MNRRDRSRTALLEGIGRTIMEIIQFQGALRECLSRMHARSVMEAMLTAWS